MRFQRCLPSFVCGTDVRGELTAVFVNSAFDDKTSEFFRRLAKNQPAFNEHSLHSLCKAAAEISAAPAAPAYSTKA